ncbi:MAG: methyltransferase domain-containing protein, partial [Acidimicrobiales bacterium]
MLVTLQENERPATADEQAVLARWSGWGSLPGVFDESDRAWSAVRERLHEALDGNAWAAARRTTINAHYTSAEVARSIWGAAVRLGFAGGRVLEPGCGSGNFIGLAPQEVQLDIVGVELDPTTARIASALYPGADIRTGGFESVRMPEASFDLVIGNVPFGKVALHDPVHNPGQHSLHNHFLIKGLHLVRPGGLVAVLTSRYTLDARNPAARREMADLADLVGAVRLPAGAFRFAAGTDAICDVLLLRRRPEGSEPLGESWERAVEIPSGDGQLTVNEWFSRHPETILGDLRASGGQYRDDDLTVGARSDHLGADLDDLLGRMAAEAVGRGLAWVPAEAARRASADHAAGVTAMVASHHKEGSLLVDGGRTGFAIVVDGVAVPYEPRPRSDRAELAALIGVRDSLVRLLDAQAASHEDGAFAEAQTVLNQRYDAYVARWGPLSRFSMVSTGVVDPETGEITCRRRNPSMGGFRRDPDFPAVTALELFDPDAQVARKAAVMTARVVAPRTPKRGADTAQDALAICLDEHGRVDVDSIAVLLGVDRDKALAELGGLVWEDPATRAFVPAAAYLAGDVRAKLSAAIAAAERDPR